VTVGAIGSILGAAMAPMQTTANVAGAAGANGVAAPATTGATQATGKGQDFGDVIANALDGLQGVQSNADGLAVKAATGDLNDVHDYMIAASEASLATEFTVALRDRAVEAFNQIMGMQI
jgi:flagellar hook-basal body complex protein FliE